MASQNPHSHTHTKRSRETEHNGETEFGQRTNDVLRDTIEEFKERSDDIKALVQGYVAEKPLKALAIAVVSGMALAMLLKR